MLIYIVYEVLTTAEISGDFISKTRSESIAGSFQLGQLVQIKKRNPYEFILRGGASYRKDVAPGTPYHIVDCEEKKPGAWWPVVEFKVNHESGEECVVCKTCNPDGLVPHTGSEGTRDGSEGTALSDSANGEKATGVKPPTAVTFIGAQPEGSKVTVHVKWTNRQAACDDDAKVSRMKDRIGFALWSVLEKMPKYSPADFAIIDIQKGDDQINVATEVWTLKDFGPCEIMFGPDATFLLDRHYTYGKSSLIRGGELLHPSSKQVVIDGKMRNKVTPLRPFSFFPCGENQRR